MYVVNIIAFILGSISIGLGIIGLINKYYDKKKEELYTKESLLKVSLISNLTNLLAGVGIILCGLSYNCLLIKDLPYTYIFLGFILLVFLVDSILESKLLKLK